MKNTEFLTGKVPITKEEIRSISLSKLEIIKKSKLLDIGSGTGTISVEACLLNKNIEIVAIEKSDSAYNLTKRNLEKFGLSNRVKLIYDIAPIELKEKFDSIFLGGSGENIDDIVRWSYEILEDGGNFVANFILIENFNKCVREMEKNGFKDIEISQVSVSNLVKLGYGNFFKPQNPIFIVSAKK